MPKYILLPERENSIHLLSNRQSHIDNNVSTKVTKEQDQRLPLVSNKSQKVNGEKNRPEKVSKLIDKQYLLMNAAR